MAIDSVNKKPGGIRTKVKYAPPAVSNFYQDSDDEILDRILASVHAKLDEEFGAETNSDPQFSKTVFKSQSNANASVAHILQNPTHAQTHGQTAMMAPNTEKFRGTASNIASLCLLSISSIYFLFEMWRTYF